MIPLIVLTAALGIFRIAGALGVPLLDSWQVSLRAALAVLFTLTASAHWGRQRPDLIRMVPPIFPRPDLLVSITGVLEILGGIGLLIPETARIAAACLGVMLVAMFPANAYAAKKRLTIGGRPVPALPVRAAIQVLFVAALVTVVWVACE
jgi:uncharacterized membrane protein